MKDSGQLASGFRDPAHELRAELARKIALFLGSAEKRVTDIPDYAKPLRVEDLAEIAGMGVSTLHRHFRC
jgi:AraC-like DNA-binding protein